MKDDISQFNMRLNLNNPMHLEIHQKLNDLNMEIHKSKNNFIIESVYRNLHNYAEDELTINGANSKANHQGYVSREEFDEMENRITEKVMKEVITLLFSSLAGRGSYVVHSQELKDEEKVEIKKERVDETLEQLACDWS